MTVRAAVVGSSGRVGGAVCDDLARRGYEVVPIARRHGESLEALALRAVARVDVVVNAAGVAHIERGCPADRERLEVGNVELPLAIGRAALSRRVPLIHISSARAADDPPRTSYALSKREADERLETELAPEFERAGLSVQVIRPFALLFPPLDAGRVRSLRFLRWWPSALTPPLRLPVLSPSTFLDAVEQAVERGAARSAPVGWSLREFARTERGTLRDVRDAMLTWSQQGGEA